MEVYSSLVANMMLGRDVEYVLQNSDGEEVGCFTNKEDAIQTAKEIAELVFVNLVCGRYVETIYCNR